MYDSVQGRGRMVEAFCGVWHICTAPTAEVLLVACLFLLALTKCEHTFKGFLATPLFFLCQLLLTHDFSHTTGKPEALIMTPCKGVMVCCLANAWLVKHLVWCFVYDTCCLNLNTGNLHCCFCRAHRRWSCKDLNRVSLWTWWA